MIARSIASALSQDAVGLEILVVDNCSTDGTWEILQQFDDARIRLVRNEHNLGLFGNFNRCIDLTRGTYLRYLCSDDTLMPGCLAREIAAMEANPKASLLSSRGLRVNSTGQVLGSHADHLPPGTYNGEDAIGGILWYKAYYGYNPLNYPSGILLRTDIIRRVGYFDASMQMAGDVDLFLRVLDEGDLVVLDEYGCRITVHQHQEGSLLTDHPVVMEEEYALFERFRRLVSATTYNALVKQLGGMSLIFACRQWRRGNTEAALRHLKIARSHGSDLLEMSAASLRMIGLRLLLKSTGLRIRTGCFDRRQHTQSAA